MRKLILAIVVGFLFPQAVCAFSYPATDALCDSSLQPVGCTDHGITIPGLADNLSLVDSIFSGDQGQAVFEGVAEDAQGGFVFSFSFLNTSPGPLKLELLAPHAYDGVDFASWQQFDLTSGTLTGFGGYGGSNLTALSFMFPLQVGVCANNKDCEFGGSFWFSVPELGMHGDANFTLANGPVSVSEPTTLFLMGVGFLLLGSFIKGGRKCAITI